MAKRYGKELKNKSLLKENFVREEFFEDAVKEKEAEFKRRFPNAEIVIKRNKNGACVTAYEKTRNK